MKTVTAYKFVRKDLKNNGFQWEVGKWFKIEGKLEICKHGFHASKEPIDVLNYYYNGERLFIVEAKGDFVNYKDKFCASQMRLVKEIPISVLKWFSIDCARHVLKFYEKKYPNDKRLEEALQAAEDYLNKKIDLEELQIKIDAARAAAWAAAWDAWDAAWAAWDAAWAARDAARDAARAARDAARDAAWAARDAERKWQNTLLKKMIKETTL